MLRVCNYYNAQGVKVVDLFSKDFEIDGFDPRSSTSGIEIGSAGEFSLLVLESAPYSALPRVTKLAGISSAKISFVRAYFSARASMSKKSQG